VGSFLAGAVRPVCNGVLGGWGLRVIDYAVWVQRLLAFAAESRPGRLRVSVSPPLGESEVAALAASLDCGLPPPLRGFLATGASGIILTHDKDDEETFSPAAQLAAWRREAKDYAQGSWVTEPDWPLDRAFWRHALPLVQYPDGDGLALWVHDAEFPEPGVLYLRHDGESVLLCRTFDEFLAAWAELEYAPAADVVECRSPSTVFLDVRSPAAAALRASLSGAELGAGPDRGGV
jgi:hypothetical protein